VLTVTKSETSFFTCMTKVSSCLTRRAPGGVFFSLVKSNTTEEERKQIFSKDKKKAAKRAKKAREDREKKRREEEERVVEGAQRELDIFRQDLAVSGEERQHPPDKNMDRRRRKKEVVEYTDLDDPVNPEDSGELDEGWRNELDDDGDSDDFTFQLSRYQQLRTKEPRSKEEDLHAAREAVGDSASLWEEKVAADQFEETDVCSLGIDISCDF
jgi:hypothetical protein